MSRDGGEGKAILCLGQPACNNSRDAPALYDAASDGSIERTLALLATGSIDVDQSDSIGWTPLMGAANGGYAHVVRVLLSAGASMSRTNDSGNTALHVSAQQGHLAVTKMLVEARTNLEAVDCGGFTPLHYAADQGRWRVVRFLAEAGANLNSRTLRGATPLVSAALKGHLEVAKELLRAGADPLLETRSQGSEEMCVPLDAAAQNGHFGVAQELIQQVGIEGCGGARGGCNALELAAQWHRVDIITLLMDAGVVDTGLALHRACMFSGEASVKLLVQQRRKVRGAGGRGAYPWTTSTSLAVPRP